MDRVLPANHGEIAEGGIRRPECTAVLYSIGVLNGFAPVVLESIRAQGLWEALAWTFGISIVDVAAVAVGVYLARQSPRTPLTLRDYVAAALFALLILVPHRAMSWAAVTGLAVYELAGNRRSAPAVAAASVFILLAASVFWGRVLAQVFAGTLLSWDAWLAAGFLDLLTGGRCGAYRKCHHDRPRVARRFGELLVATQRAIWFAVLAYHRPRVTA